MPRCPHCGGTLLPAVEPTTTGFNALDPRQIRDCLACSRRSQWSRQDGWQLLTVPLCEPVRDHTFRQPRLGDLIGGLL